MARTTRSSVAKAAQSPAKGKEATSTTQQLSSPPSTPAPGSRKRSRKSGNVKKEDDGDVNELPHNLGTALPTPGADDDADPSPPKKRTKRSKLKAEETEDLKENLVDAAIKAEDEDVKPEESPKKTPKKANYGLTPGQTPYPDYPRPTPEECKEVVRLLEKVHGQVVVPKAIPPPSLDVSGCGEVPSVLDALIRTRLSANTTNKNSSTAFQGLVKRFGVLESGIGKGSVDWDAVRRAPQKEVFKAIERGGLADRKSKDIQAIIQIAYDENQERKAALLQSSDGTGTAEGVEYEPNGEKNTEIEKASKNIISLDHLHLLSTDDAIEKMLSLPGIGPKTASCVALFCLQRPSFAVDTHVFRLCQYLGWVPKNAKKGQPKVDRNTTYNHCDVRIPDEFKYSLHQLLIKHGKTCPRCRAITGQSSASWEKGCPIEHLVKRHGAKKGGISIADRKKAMEAAGMEEGEAAKVAEADAKAAEEEGQEAESDQYSAPPKEAHGRVWYSRPREYGKGARSCRVTGDKKKNGIIRKYGLNMSRQAFREKAE
ncbi:DNA glycosylase, partial [Hortaea werneckii]